MPSIKELFEKDKTLFDGFDSQKWMQYYAAINDELTPEECCINLTENEKLCYLNELNSLREDRAEYPWRKKSLCLIKKSLAMTGR